MSDANTAISGSRDTTLRVWDIRTGLCRNVLVGHQSSVRCLEIKGDIVVSGSYDTTAKVWSLSDGRCLQTLHGHFSQIYAIAFDGRRVVTGSLDTQVRIWNPNTGYVAAHDRLSLSLKMSTNFSFAESVLGSSRATPLWLDNFRCVVTRLLRVDPTALFASGRLSATAPSIDWQRTITV